MTSPPSRNQVGTACDGCAVGRVVESYLAEVAAELPGSARARAGILAELRAGLLDATDAHRRTGLGLHAAADAATSEFGDPAELAGAFGPGARR